MSIFNDKNAFRAFGATILTAIAIGVAFFGSHDFILIPTKADQSYTFNLDNTNSPSLSSGSGTMLDAHQVTWEYSNCASYGSGHVTINHTGYFGIKSNSANHYGYTGISQITASFSTVDGKLWLLKSVDGTTWNEEKMLVSGEPVTGANNWRYIRFYNYSENSNVININSIQIIYSCTGSTSSEDVDLAKIDNILEVSGVTPSHETSLLSPREPNNSTTAVSYTKQGGDTYTIFSLKATYDLEDIKDKKIEFDYRHTNRYKPKVNFYYTLKEAEDKRVGLILEYDDTKPKPDNYCYRVTNINDDWWHIEIPVTALAPTLVSSKWDNPIPANSKIDSIKIGNGACTIDNLRLSSTPTELGLFNQGFTVTGRYWIKTTWTGKLHVQSVSITFDVPNALEWIDPDLEPNAEGSPFYIRKITGGTTGTVIATISLRAGYDRHLYTTTTTLTVS